MIVAVLVICFAILQSMVALVNLFFRQPLSGNQAGFNRKVSVLIPARNEENNIGNLLSDLIRQHDPEMDILVYDDQSTDQTAEMVRKMAAKDNRIRLLPAENLQAGWLGKNFACHRLAADASGDYYLFLDADVRISSGIIRKTAGFAAEKQLGLVSVFPQQIMVSPGEKSSVPLMHFILLTLLPLILVRKSAYPSLSAANGQFMLFSAKTYHELKPHEKMKSEKVEDICIARWLKKSGIAVACLTGIKEIRCRMYTGFQQATDGFAKNVTAFFGNSFVLAFLFWMTTSAGWVVVFYILGLWAGFAYLFLLLLTRILVSLAAKQKVIQNIVYWIPQQIALGFILFKAVQSKFNREYQWKGRNIQ